MRHAVAGWNHLQEPTPRIFGGGEGPYARCQAACHIAHADMEPLRYDTEANLVLPDFVLTDTSVASK